MKIKTFQAMTMQEALKAIKAELGPDAVILSTKSLDPGKTRFGLLGRSMVEVTAAVDRQVKLNAPAGRSGAIENDHAKAAPRATVRFRDVLSSSLGAASSSPVAHGNPASSSGFHQRSSARPDLDPVLEELKHIRECLRTAGAVPKPVEELPEALHRYRDELLARGLDQTTVLAIVRDAAARLTKDCPDTAMRRAMAAVIEPRILTSGPLLQSDEKRKIVILVGPTGVGKTTTLAKLAAHYRLHEHRPVALITLDTYRLAAVEQLRTYATLIGVPMDVALTRRDAIESIGRRPEADLILIDTAGRSPRDAGGMTELRQLLDLGNPVDIHLVLSATTRERDLLENVQRFQSLPINRLLFTKLDETDAHGAVFEVMQRTRLPLSYLTRGQRVPEDLDIATPATVAQLLVGPSMAIAMTAPTATI